MSTPSQPKSGKKSKRILPTSIAIGGSAIATGLFYQLLQYSPQLINSYEPKSALISSFTNDAKLYMVLNPGLMIALFLFGLTLAIMTLRVTTGRSNPVQFQDPVIIVAINRIFTNTVEQTLIFAFNYGYFVYFVCTPQVALKAYFLSWIFVASRVIFLITYSLGTFINITSLRALGFWLTVLVQITFFVENFGCSVISKFL